jgi:diacylglycerol kinase (ATP)
VFANVHAAVIANPNAGYLKRRPRLLADLAKLSDRDTELCLTHDQETLVETAQRLAEAGCQHVGLVGGDGTASATLSALAAAYGERLLPTIVLLRGGTMNTVANALGIARGKPAALLRDALGAWKAPGKARTCVRPTLRVGDRLGFLFGTGVWHGYLSAYYEAGDGAPTPATAARVFGSAVASALVDGSLYRRVFRPAPIRVELGGAVWETRTYMTVCAGTVDQAGLGFRVFHRAYDTDDRFHLIGIKGSPGQVARDLPGVWTGQGLKAETAYQALVAQAEIRCDEGKFGYSVDGDLYEADGRLALGLGPSFRFLLPGRAID